MNLNVNDTITMDDFISEMRTSDLRNKIVRTEEELYQDAQICMDLLRNDLDTVLIHLDMYPILRFRENPPSLFYIMPSYSNGRLLDCEGVLESILEIMLTKDTLPIFQELIQRKGIEDCFDIELWKELKPDCWK